MELTHRPFDFSLPSRMLADRGNDRLLIDTGFASGFPDIQSSFDCNLRNTSDNNGRGSRIYFFPPRGEIKRDHHLSAVLPIPAFGISVIKSQVSFSKQIVRIFRPVEPPTSRIHFVAVLAAVPAKWF